MGRREATINRQRAFRRTFDPKAKDAQYILADLAKFCHAQRTTFVVGDTHGSALLEGRRQVFLRIREYLDIPEALLREIIDNANQEEAE